MPSAKRDLQKGIRFYKLQQADVGGYFLDSVYSDIDSISLFGGIHRKRGNLFRFRSKRFPFWNYYRIEKDTAYVVAVLDARQDPGKIRRREGTTIGPTDWLFRSPRSTAIGGLVVGGLRTE